MTVKELVERTGYRVLAQGDMSSQVKGGYTGDLLSDVVAKASEGSVWITVQKHVNIIAVAALRSLPAIIVCGGREVPEETLAVARREGITVLSAEDNAFEVSGQLYCLLKGR